MLYTLSIKFCTDRKVGPEKDTMGILLANSAISLHKPISRRGAEKDRRQKFSASLR